MIARFEGKYRFLSNFYPSIVTSYFNGEARVAPTVKHAYQAEKASIHAQWSQVLKEKTPGGAKRHGKLVFMRLDWDNVKLDVMERLLREKFSNPTLKKMLLDTGTEELVEGNYWNDTFWGVCRGIGQNNLGKILMKIRS